jgi:hypothetical protein
MFDKFDPAQLLDNPIVAGVTDHFAVAAAVIIITTAGPLIINVIWPLIEGMIHDVPRIAGRWVGAATTAGTTPVVTSDIVEIKQRGHQCRGTITVSGTRMGNYNFTGTFFNRILTATYHSSDNRKLNRGSLALMLNPDGTTFKGICVHYDEAGNHTMKAQDYRLTLQSP